MSLSFRSPIYTIAIFCLLIAFGMYCGASRAVATEKPVHKPFDDRPMLCAAYYGHLAQGFKDKREPKKAQAYQAKFRILYARGIKNMIASGSTRDEAHTMTQKYADLLGELALKQAAELRSIASMCQREFPVPTIWN
jgi:hypothetical protein